MDINLISFFQDASRKMDLSSDNTDLKVDQRKRHLFRLVLWPRTSNICNYLNQSRIRKTRIKNIKTSLHQESRALATAAALLCTLRWAQRPTLYCQLDFGFGFYSSRRDHASLLFCFSFYTWFGYKFRFTMCNNRIRSDPSNRIYKHSQTFLFAKSM